jgi:hypothetical protein
VHAVGFFCVPPEVNIFTDLKEGESVSYGWVAHSQKLIDDHTIFVQSWHKAYEGSNFSSYFSTGIENIDIVYHSHFILQIWSK